MNHDITDKFSTHLKNVLTRALCFVVETGGGPIGPEHLLWALGTQKGCIGAEALAKAGVRSDALRKLVGARATKPQDPSTLPIPAELGLSDDSKRVIEKAVLTANVYGHRYVGTEHLLSGLLQVPIASIADFFEAQAVDLKELRSQVALVLKSTTKFPDLADTIAPAPGQELAEAERPSADEPKDKKKTPALDYFGRELTSPKLQESIDPVIGREREIDRIMQILCRRTKNNPLLLGEPGVGKTAIVEGLAKRILEGDVPPVLADKRVVALDLSMLIAGTMYRGEFEARMKQVMEELREHPDIILFVDEIHTLVGAGAASGSLDAANMLKPALARGEIRCIGATTFDEYKKHLETDSALERRFQTLSVDEPTAEKALEILRGVAPHYERFHGLRIAPEALEEAVSLSCRFLHSKQLPDKALDLIDEAAASARVRRTEPGPFEERRLLTRRLDELEEEKRQAVVEERFLEAIALKEEEAHVREVLAKTPEPDRESLMLVTGADVARATAAIAGLPEEAILREVRKETAGGLESGLAGRVFGQDAVVRTVADSLRRAKAGLGHPDRPLGSFLFAGPSGVGKTELAKAMAAEFFHDPKAFVRLDMSEFSEGFTLSKLVGAPAGYVGYREGAKLTDAVKRRPHCLVLFDEIEKAHRDVQNILLQILEEGELTDATGRKVSFRQAVIVMTSNVGLERFGQGGFGFAADAAEARARLAADIRTELDERFRPELVNRIDHICLFDPLAHETLERIASAALANLRERLLARGIELETENGVAEALARTVSKKDGARGIRRVLQNAVEHPLAERLSRGAIPKRFVLRVKNGKIGVVRYAQRSHLKDAGHKR